MVNSLYEGGWLPSLLLLCWAASCYYYCSCYCCMANIMLFWLMLWGWGLGLMLAECPLMFETWLLCESSLLATGTFWCYYWAWCYCIITAYICWLVAWPPTLANCCYGKLCILVPPALDPSWCYYWYYCCWTYRLFCGCWPGKPPTAYILIYIQQTWLKRKPT